MKNIIFYIFIFLLQFIFYFQSHSQHLEIINADALAYNDAITEHSCIVKGNSFSYTTLETLNKIFTITLPTPVFLSGSATVCGKQAGVTYTISPVTGATYYNWTLPSGSIITANSGTSITVTFGVNSGNVCVTAFNSCSTSLPSCYSVTVIPDLPVSVRLTSNPSGNVCSGISITFTATHTNGGTNPSYQWNNKGIPISGAINSTYSYTPVSGDAISCLLTSNAVCAIGSPALSVTDVAYQNLPVSVSITANPSGAICAGTSVAFTATPINGGTSPSYQWNIAGVAISGATGSVYTYAPNNGDAITCTLTSSNPICATGNPYTSSVITETVNPNLPVSVSINSNPSVIVCGVNVTFTATATNGGTSPSYKWYNGGIAISGATASTYSYIPTSGDAINCVLTSNAVCPAGNPATSLTYTINPMPVSVTISATPSGAICSGTSVTFTATPTNGGTTPSYQWNKGGIAIGGATTSLYSYYPNNGDVITCVLISNATCPTGNPFTSSGITETVNPLPTITGTSTTPGTLTGDGTITLNATASAGTINWWAASNGGSPLSTGTSSYTTPCLILTNTYYVDATSGSCTSATRTSVSANIAKTFQVDNNCSLTTGLISYWEMEGNSNDFYSSYNGTDATMTYATAYGKINKGADFTGSPSKITYSHISALDVGTGDLSVAFWIYLTGTWSGVTKGIIGQKTNDSSPGFQVYHDSISNLIQMRLGGSSNGPDCGVSVPTGTWEFLVFLRKSGTVYAYLNGTNSNSATNTSNISGSATFYIGYAATWSAYMNGYLDEVGVWNKALTQSEINDLYNSTNGQTMH